MVFVHAKPLALTLKDAIDVLHQPAGVLAYPTESVFGLGCDPDSLLAIDTLLSLKQRSVKKGLILVAAYYEQLLPYIDDSQLTFHQRQRVLESWPGAVTWVMPKRIHINARLSGEFDTLAVRVSAHPDVQALCRVFGKPLVSTSANLSGECPCKTVEEVWQQFGSTFPVLAGNIGGNPKPTVIYHSLTNRLIRE